MPYTRTRVFYGAVIPSATRVHACLCGLPNCRHVHLIGMDEDEEPLFEIVLSEDVNNEISEMFRNMK